MTVSVDDLKTSLRLDDTSDAETAALQGYLAAAESYVKDAVGADDDGFFADKENNDLYNIAVLSLAGAYYQNPVALTTGTSTPVYLVMSNIIGQLRARLEVSQDGSTQ